MGDSDEKDQGSASGSLSRQGAVPAARSRRWAGIAALALLGLALTAGITLAANSLVSQPIGLSSEPATLGDSLAPASQQVAPAPATTERTRTVTRTVTVPRTTTSSPSTTPATTTTPGDDREREDREREREDEDHSGRRGGEEREDDDD